jgi:hypothetical protein
VGWPLLESGLARKISLCMMIELIVVAYFPDTYHEESRVPNSCVRPWIGYIQVDVAFLSSHGLDWTGYMQIQSKPHIDLYPKYPHRSAWTEYRSKSMWTDLGPWTNWEPWKNPGIATCRCQRIRFGYINWPIGPATLIWITLRENVQNRPLNVLNDRNRLPCFGIPQNRLCSQPSASHPPKLCCGSQPCHLWLYFNLILAYSAMFFTRKLRSCSPSATSTCMHSRLTHPGSFCETRGLFWGIPKHGGLFRSFRALRGLFWTFSLLSKPSTPDLPVTTGVWILQT